MRRTAELLRELIEHVKEDVNLDSVSTHLRESLLDAQEHLTVLDAYSNPALRVQVSFDVLGVFDPDGQEATDIVAELTELTRDIALQGLACTSKPVFACVDDAKRVSRD